MPDEPEAGSPLSICQAGEGGMRRLLLLAAGLAAVAAPARAEDLTGVFAALPQARQRALLAEFVRDADNRCDEVVRHFFAGGGNGEAAWWDVECARRDTDRRASYRLRLPPRDDTVRVIRCEQWERGTRERFGEDLLCFQPLNIAPKGKRRPT